MTLTGASALIARAGRARAARTARDRRRALANRRVSQKVQNDDVGVPSASSSDPDVRGAVWLARSHDLRMRDNEAFISACAEARAVGGVVACVFAWSERDARESGGARRAWLAKALEALDRDLRRTYGGGVSMFKGEGAEGAMRAARAIRATRVFASKRYEPENAEADERASVEMAVRGVELVRTRGFLLFEPSEVRIDVAARDGYFGTLMPFVHAAERTCGDPGKPKPAPVDVRMVDLGTESDHEWEQIGLEDLGVAPASDRRVDWSVGIRADWDISEGGAVETWSQFTAVGLDRFEAEHGRADPEAGVTVSRLSPYLRFGMISPRTVYHDLVKKDGKTISKTFWHRLYRRELAYWQLHHWPDLPKTSVRSHYENRAWLSGDEADEALRRWQRGETGFPVVDCGMRRLWRTGWMHQTERMITATFLVDYLGVHWTRGADWFMRTLVDADEAINSMMWQNAGKSGLDQWDFFEGTLAPDGSARAHDPHGDAIARWIPELAALPRGYLRHRPWEASKATLAECDVELGSTYPRRMIVDLDRARQRMLDDVTTIRHAELVRAGGLVKPGSMEDLVVAPRAAVVRGAADLARVSTRKEFKRTLKALKASIAGIDLPSNPSSKPHGKSRANASPSEVSAPSRPKSGPKSGRLPAFDRDAARASRREFKRLDAAFRGHAFHHLQVDDLDDRDAAPPPPRARRRPAR